MGFILRLLRIMLSFHAIFIKSAILCFFSDLFCRILCLSAVLCTCVSFMLTNLIVVRLTLLCGHYSTSSVLESKPCRNIYLCYAINYGLDVLNASNVFLGVSSHAFAYQGGENLWNVQRNATYVDLNRLIYRTFFRTNHYASNAFTKDYRNVLFYNVRFLFLRVVVPGTYILVILMRQIVKVIMVVFHGTFQATA